MLNYRIPGYRNYSLAIVFSIVISMAIVSTIAAAECYEFGNSYTDTYNPGWVTCGTSGTAQIGLQIKPNFNVALTSFMVNQSTVFNNCWVADSNHAIILNATKTDHNCSFSVGAVNLTAGQTYYLTTDASVRCYGNDIWPKYSLRINATNGAFNNGAWNLNGWFDIVNITTMNLTEISCPATPTTCLILADGSSVNQTFNNNTNINITGINSISGLNISIFDNDFLVQDSLTPNIWIGKIDGVGEHNISAVYDGNDTYLPCYDNLWLNITQYEGPVTPAVPVSYKICYDNNTLLLNSTTIINGLVNNTYIYQNCPYGCDSVLLDCGPPPYIEDLINILIVIGGLAAFLWIMRWLDR